MLTLKVKEISKIHTLNCSPHHFDTEILVDGEKRKKKKEKKSILQNLSFESLVLVLCRFSRVLAMSVNGIILFVTDREMDTDIPAFRQLSGWKNGVSKFGAAARSQIHTALHSELGPSDFRGQS